MPAPSQPLVILTLEEAQQLSEMLADLPWRIANGPMRLLMMATNRSIPPQPQAPAAVPPHPAQPVTLDEARELPAPLNELVDGGMAMPDGTFVPPAEEVVDELETLPAAPEPTTATAVENVPATVDPDPTPAPVEKPAAPEPPAADSLTAAPPE